MYGTEEDDIALKRSGIFVGDIDKLWCGTKLPGFVPLLEAINYLNTASGELGLRCVRGSFSTEFISEDAAD